MNCEQARNLFDAYLDGELSSALETELHAHRLQCPSCRQALALMEVTGHVIASGADEPRLGAGFADRLLACLAPELPTRHPARKWLFRIGGPVAAAACLTMLISFLIRPEPRVAGMQQRADHGAVIATIPEQPPVETPSAGLDAAAATLRQAAEDAWRGTDQSSASLRYVLRAATMQMVETLELVPLPDSDSPDEPWPDELPGENADAVEEL